MNEEVTIHTNNAFLLALALLIVVAPPLLYFLGRIDGRLAEMKHHREAARKAVKEFDDAIKEAAARRAGGEGE